MNTLPENERRLPTTDSLAAGKTGQAAQDRLEKVFARLNDHFVVFDRDWCYTYVNDAAARMLGLPKEQLIGQRIWDLFPEAVGNLFYREVQRALAEQRDLSFDHFYAPWGRWFENRVYAFPDGVSVFSVDITERKRADLQVALHAQLLESMVDAVFMTDAQLNVTQWYRGAEEVYGWKADEVLGRNVGEVLGSTYSAEQQLEAARQVAQQGKLHLELLHRRKDGTPVFIDGVSIPIREDGQVIGYMTVNRDVTERKQAEAALRASEERFAKAFHASPQPMSITRVEDGGYIDANESFAHMVGYLRSEIIGRTSFDIGIWSDPQERAAANEVILAQSGNRDFTHRFHDRNGEVHEIVASGQLIDLGGQPCILSVISDVTEFVQAEEALRSSEERFRALANLAPTMVWTAAPDGTITFANERWLQYVGITPAANAQGWPELVLHPDDYERCMAQWTRALQLGSAYEIEVRNRRYDGEYRWFLTRALPIRDEDGHITTWFGTTTDIHERKQADLNRQFLVDLDTQIRLLTDCDAISRTTVGALGKYLDVAQCYFNQIDVEADQALVAHDWHRADARGVAGVYALSAFLAPALKAAFQAGQACVVSDVTTDPRLAGLVERYVDLAVYAFAAAPCLQDGWWVAVLVVQSDRPRIWRNDEVELLSTVAARVWPLIERTRALQALRASEANYRALFESASDGIFITDDQGIYVDANTRACVLSGYTREELIGKHLRDLTPPADWPRLDVDRAALLDGSSQISEWRLLCKDGRALPIEVSAKQLPDGRWQAFARDITERIHHEEELRQLNATLEQRVRERTAELERTNRELDQFAYVASHDLRSPLRGIDHLAQFIAQDSGHLLPQSSLEHLVKLRSRIKRMDNLLIDLLAFFRADRLHYPPERVDTAQFVRDASDLLALPPGFTVRVSDSMPTLIAERIPLETVLRNLIDNAAKHHNFPTLGHVVVSAQDKGQFIEFIVADDGPGIAPDFHDRIFEIFQTLKPRDEVEGSGMGLTVVRRLVESRGGTIRVESSAGHGATFRFTWPKA